MQTDVLNVQIVTRRLKSGQPGYRTCTKHIVTRRTVVILSQRSNEIKKKQKNSTLDGFLRPRPAFVASTVQPIPIIHSLPVTEEGTSTALPSTVISVAEESDSDLLKRIQKIAGRKEWYHLARVKLEQAPRNWVCDACQSSQGGKHLRR